MKKPLKPQDIVHHLLQNWDTWVPSPSDIKWTEDNLNGQSHGTKWVTSQCMFNIDKQKKELVFLAGTKGEIFQKVSKVLPLIGWRMVVPPDDEPPPPPAKGDEQSFPA
jgi:hypothetical protein